MNKRYLVSYIAYELGNDDGVSGWQSFYSHVVVDNKPTALQIARDLRERTQFYKNVFVSEEIEEI